MLQEMAVFDKGKGKEMSLIPKVSDWRSMVSPGQCDYKLAWLIHNQLYGYLLHAKGAI